MREAGFGDVRIAPVTHGLVVDNVDQFWRDMVRGTAPITLMKHHASRQEWGAIETPRARTSSRHLAEIAGHVGVAPLIWRSDEKAERHPPRLSASDSALSWS